MISLPNKFTLALAGGLFLALLGVLGYMAIRDHQRAAQIVELQNEVASRDTTIETQEGLYQKLAISSSDLKSLLDSKDQQLNELNAQLKKTGDQLLTANTVIITLKQKLVQTGTATTTITPIGNTDTKEIRLYGESNEGPFRIECNTFLMAHINNSIIWTLDATQKPTFSIGLSQIRPMRISVVVSQLKDGSWRASTTSSEEIFNLDLALAAVNPYLLEEKWYEKLAFSAEVGVGTNPGFLAGLGVDIELGKVDVGPRVWAVVDHGASAYFGASLAWHPFRKVR